jgi:hypothetical protein
MTSGISQIQINKLKELYLKEGRSMFDISKYFGVSIDVISYAMRKYNIPRRSLKEASKKSFENKKPSFYKNKIKGIQKITSEIILAMLYWGEGFKGAKNRKYGALDFANSDSEMIRLYIKMLRNLYNLDEKRLRVFLYCYKNQNQKELIKYWSKVTQIPVTQFTKPYVRDSVNKNGRVMKYGLIHIRYSDKKLLKEVKNLIDCVRKRYAPVV